MSIVSIASVFFLFALFVFLIFRKGIIGLALIFHIIGFGVLAFILGTILNGKTFSPTIWIILVIVFMFSLGISIFLRRKF